MAGCGRKFAECFVRTFCCVGGSYTFVDYDLEKDGFDEKGLPALIDIFTELRSCSPSAWVSILRGFHMMVVKNDRAKECIVENRIQWKLHFLRFLTIELQNMDSGGSNRTLATSLHSGPSLASELLRQAVLIMAEIDVVTLLSTTNPIDTHLARSVQMIDKACLVSRLPSDVCTLHQHHLLALVLDKVGKHLSRPLPKVPSGLEIEIRGSSEDGQQSPASGRNSLMRTETKKIKMGKLSSAAIAAGESAFTAAQWAGLDRLLKAAGKAIFQPPSRATLEAGFGGGGAHVDPPAFTLRVRPAGRFACEGLAEAAKRVVNLPVVTATLASDAAVNMMQLKATKNRLSPTRRVIIMAEARARLVSLRNQREVFQWLHRLVKAVRQAGETSHRGKRRSKRALYRIAKSPTSSLNNTCDALSSAVSDFLGITQAASLHAVQQSLRNIDASMGFVIQPDNSPTRSKYISEPPSPTSRAPKPPKSKSKVSRFSIDDAANDYKRDSKDSTENLPSDSYHLRNNESRKHGVSASASGLNSPHSLKAVGIALSAPAVKAGQRAGGVKTIQESGNSSHVSLSSGNDMEFPDDGLVSPEAAGNKTPRKTDPDISGMGSIGFRESEANKKEKVLRDAEDIAATEAAIAQMPDLGDVEVLQTDADQNSEIVRRVSGRAHRRLRQGSGFMVARYTGSNPKGTSSKQTRTEGKSDSISALLGTGSTGTSRGVDEKAEKEFNRSEIGNRGGRGGKDEEDRRYSITSLGEDDRRATNGNNKIKEWLV